MSVEKGSQGQVMERPRINKPKEVYGLLGRKDPNVKGRVDQQTGIVAEQKSVKDGAKVEARDARDQSVVKEPGSVKQERVPGSPEMTEGSSSVVKGEVKPGVEYPVKPGRLNSPLGAESVRAQVRAAGPTRGR